MTNIQLLPKEDKYNMQLVADTHPPQWVNPKANGRYNLVIIGAGSAGLTAAAGAAGLGAKVALIEKEYMGGDCLHVGCVPSKAVIRSGRVAAAVADAARYGIGVPEGVSIDFATVMGRMRQVRAHISPHDSAARFTKLGVDVYFGAAEFTGRDTLQVAGQTLQFSKALIATGSSPASLPLPGLEAAGYLTNVSFFNLTERPKRLAVIGGGPIGAELAQTMQRLGSAVTLLDIAPKILPREDKDAAEIVQKALLEDGVTLLLGTKTTRAEADKGEKIIYYEKDGQSHCLRVDEILLAVGRRPNIEGLNLNAAGVDFHEAKGVKVNDYLQTSNSKIYAAGDVALKYQFTHVAGHSAAIALQNALFPAPKRKFSDLVIPWVTYTDPEVAHVGLYPGEAAEQGSKIETYFQAMDSVDRAVAEGELTGFVKIHVKKGTGKILGATVVNSVAGEMINEITLAMKHDLGLGALATLIHPYPTQAESISKAAIAYRRTKLTPLVSKIFTWWLARTR